MPEAQEIQQVKLEICPESAVLWATEKNDIAREIIRLKYQNGLDEKAATALKTAVEVEVEREADERTANGDKSLSNEAKRRNEIQMRLAGNQAYNALLAQIESREQQIEFKKTERDYAHEMYWAVCQFAGSNGSTK